MNNALIPSNEFEKLKERINLLKAEIARLTQEKHDLEYEEGPRLTALFMEKVGDLVNLMEALELTISELKYRIRLVQRALNRAEALKKEQMDQKVSEEYQEYHKKVDEKFRQAKEAKEQENAREQKQAEQEKRYNQRQEEKNKTTREMAKTDSVESQQKQGKTFHENSGTGEKQDNTSQKDSGANDKKEDEFSGMTFKQKVKELYRRIVKKLHPDMNPNVTDREKELWLKAQEAYQEFDLETLESIYDEITQVAAEDIEETEDGLEKLLQMVERLERQRDELLAEIAAIKSDFPFDQKAFLEDEEQVATVQKAMGEKIEQYRDQIKQLTEYLEQLMAKLKSE